MDEFPSLEAVVGLGLLVVVVRTFVLLRAARAIASDHDALLRELGRADRTRALALVETFESAGYGDVAVALLTRAGELGEATRDEARVELARAFDEAEAHEARRTASARGRDLVVLALLVGLVAYVARAGWHASTLFFALAASSALVVIAGLGARRTILPRLRERRTALLDAITEHALSRAPAPPSGPCPMCDGTEYVAALHPQRVKSEGAAQALGLEELNICRRCGFVRGRVSDPDAIAVGDATDTVLAQSPSEDPMAGESDEHEG